MQPDGSVVGVLTYRRLRPEDFPLLPGWLAAPHVARWWNHEVSWRALENAGRRHVGDGAFEPDNPIDDPLHGVLGADRPGDDG